MRPLGYAAAPWKDSGQHRRQRRNGERGDDKRGPDRARTQRQTPADDEREHAGRRQQRPAQIVEHLPPADQRYATARASAASAAGVATTEQPRQQLPVAARPTVRPRRRDVVARWIL